MYKLLKNQSQTGLAECVLRTADGACIPFDPANTDYIAYLKWIEDGNSPEPAEENQ